MPNEDPYDRYLEKRAEELGLPTDPAAYQDGGLAVAAVEGTLAEAETLAALLKSNDVPAWVKSPMATLMAAEPQQFSVLVPYGRLADVRRLIAEHPHQEAPPEEAEEVAEAPEQAEEGPAQPAKPAPRLSAARIAASIIILGFGILTVLQTAAITLLDKGPFGFVKIVVLGVVGAFGVGACAIGIGGLTRPPESKP
jgi:hypothetical protein